MRVFYFFRSIASWCARAWRTLLIAIGDALFALASIFLFLLSALFFFLLVRTGIDFLQEGKLEGLVLVGTPALVLCLLLLDFFPARK